MTNSEHTSNTMHRPISPVWFVMAVACILAFAFQGSRGLFETTEGRYAEVAREMLETRNWLVPQLDYAPHWTKPPMTYWAIAGGMALLGRNEWGVRLYNAVAFLAVVWAVGRLAKRWWDERTAYVAALLYATSPYAVYAAFSVSTDLLLSLWQLLVVVSYFEGLNAPDARRRSYWVAALWASAGLGFLTKGPPSLLTPLVLILYQFYRKWTGRPTVRMVNVLGLVSFAILGLSWYGIVVIRTPGLLRYFLGVEVLERIFTPHLDRNPHWYGPFLIYGPPLLLGAGPVAFAWLILLKRRLASVRWVEFKRLFLSDDKAAFLVLWLSLPVLVLSLSQSRLPLYVLPFFPAVILATARVLLLTLDPLTFDRRLWTLALAMGLILAAAKGVVTYAPLSANMKQFHDKCRQVAGPKAGFFTFDSTKLCGLQFYLHGQMKRVSDDPAAPPSQEPLQNVLEEIRARPVHDPYVFISTARRNDTALTALLDAAQVAYTAVPLGGHYRLFVVPTRMPSPS